MLKMLGSYLLIKRDEEETELKDHKIILADNRDELPFTCTVLAVGPGEVLPCCVREKMDVKPGDKIICLHGQGVPFEGNTIIHCEMIEGTVEE